jgi:serine protease Do
MDPYDKDRIDDLYPRHDYYSTGGSYRPAKPHRNHGYTVAALGLVLLFVAGISVLYPGQNQEATQEQPETMAATTYMAAETEEVQAEAAQAENVQAEEAETEENQDTQAVLGSGAELVMNEGTGETMELSEIYKKVIPSVVSISATGSGSTSTGTGIIMSQDGYIITNYHVVSTASQITVLLTDETEYAATVVGGDETSDLMVLKIDAENLTPAEFGDSDQMEVGDAVVAIGDPLGIELRGTMTNGIICGIKRDVSVEDRTMTLMQTNAALNSGNSGGPLVNMMGQVIGINTMKLTSDYSSVEGIGFAIPISTAKPIVDELVEKGYVTGRPAFGFTVETLDARILLYYNLPGWLCVRSVDVDSDAYAQGIREGDIITSVDGTTVSSTEELSRIKNSHTAGDQVTMTIYRNGKNYEVTVTLMEQNEQ